MGCGDRGGSVWQLYTWPSPSIRTAVGTVTINVAAGFAGDSAHPGQEAPSCALGLQRPLRRPLSLVAVGNVSNWARLHGRPGVQFAQPHRALSVAAFGLRLWDSVFPLPTPLLPATFKLTVRAHSGHARLRLPPSVVTTVIPGGGACLWLGQTC